MSSTNARPRAGPFHVKTLVVDPDQASATALLRSAPIIDLIAIVPSAAEALNTLQVTTPQLLVTELELADASGIELIRRVRQLNADRRLPLMVITSHAAVADKVAAFRAGADDFLIKPVDPAFFSLRVRQLMIFFLLDIH
jgi:DNA-binding response OmpR family regulator